jgi:hypothetical protein
LPRGSAKSPDVFETLGVEPVFPKKDRQSITRRAVPASAQARFGFSIQRAMLSASFRSTTRIASYDAVILPLPAGTLTQLEMFQKRLKVLGETLGHTPSLGVFCWLEVTDFDRFFGFLFLVLHVCYLSFAGYSA